MGLTDWASRTIESVRQQGLVAGIRDALYELRVGAVRRITSPSHDPDYVWDEDWDVLVVLDACRLDLMQEVADEYPFIEEVGMHMSAATSTTAWSRRNFAPEFSAVLADTTYVTANPNSITIGSIDLPETCQCGEPVRHDGRALTVACPECGEHTTCDRRHPFGRFVELWRSNWEEELGTLLPGTVTARAIELMREENPDTLIVHYNQPHHPFVVQDGDDIRTAFDLGEHTNVWEALRKGTVSETDVWKAYRDNLRYVLDSVSDLVTNVDAEMVIITSDHGNALGEWGIYGHPNPPVPIDVLVEVPWIVTSARNTEGQRPETIAERTSEVEENVEERLRDLGYV